jgi:hypothetical protein
LEILKILEKLENLNFGNFEKFLNFARGGARKDMKKENNIYLIGEG